MVKGYDPILLEEQDITKWISENIDNFVLVLPDKKNILLKKSYFLNPHVNDIYLQCEIESGALMLKKTKKSKLYRNIGYFFGKYTMIDDKELIRNLKQKKNIYELKSKKLGTNDIVPFDQWEEHEANFINQETLLLTHIDLFKVKGNSMVKNKKQFGKNIPHKEEVYFNKLMSDALYNYSWQWDAPINNYLRTGNSYWNTALFTQYMSRYGNNRENAIKNVKSKIESIDKCFMEVAPRNQNDKKLYYRGMKFDYAFSGVKYSKNVGIGTEDIVRNFTSVSENIKVAISFIDHIKVCCLYEIQVDKGIPYINMVTNTKFKREKEILLPRDLVFKLIGFRDMTLSNGKKIRIRVIKISKMRHDQFKLDTGCNIYPIVNIEPLKQLKNTPIPKKKKENIKILEQVPKNIENNLEPAEPAKKPKCSKGSRRDKKTGLCTDKDGNVVNQVDKIKNKTVKQKRCPNGMRKNKNGICEPK